MSDLSLLLFKTPPRDFAGSRTSNRFNFQINFALCKLLELDLKKDSYAVVCDYHEDLMVLDDEVEPNSAIPIQVKTGRNTPWTLTSIVTPKKGKNGEILSSILGKLYQGCESFKHMVPEICLVTTNGFKLKLKSKPESTSRTRFSSFDLEDSEREKIGAFLKKEFGSSENHTLEPPFTLEVTSLSLNDHETHTTGIIAKYLSEKFPTRILPAPAAYQALHGELNRLTSSEAVCGSLEELIRKKGIGSTKFRQLVSSIAALSREKSFWEEAHKRLLQESISLSEESRLKQNWGMYEADRMDASNVSLQRVREKVRASMIRCVESSSGESLMSIASQAIEGKVEGLQKGRFYFLAMAIFEFYEHSISATDPQPEEETQ